MWIFFQLGNHWSKKLISTALCATQLTTVEPLKCVFSVTPAYCLPRWLFRCHTSVKKSTRGLPTKVSLAGQELTLVLVTSSTITSCNQMRKHRRRECKGCYQQCTSTHVQLFGWMVCKTLLWNNALYKYPAKRILNRYLISSVIWEGWLNTAGLLMWEERFKTRDRKKLN